MATPVHKTLKSAGAPFSDDQHYFVEEETAAGDDDDDDETFMTNNKVHAELPFTPLLSALRPSSALSPFRFPPQM